jgi:hypothetical protein
MKLGMKVVLFGAISTPEKRVYANGQSNINTSKVKVSRYMPWWHMRGEEV